MGGRSGLPPSPTPMPPPALVSLNWGSVGVKHTLITGHSSTVMTTAFSPDGAVLVSGSIDNTLKVWDATNWGTVLATLTGHTGAGVMTSAFSPDGAVLVSGAGDNTLKVWDATNWGTVLATLTGHTSMVYTSAFSP